MSLLSGPGIVGVLITGRACIGAFANFMAKPEEFWVLKNAFYVGGKNFSSRPSEVFEPPVKLSLLSIILVFWLSYFALSICGNLFAITLTY